MIGIVTDSTCDIPQALLEQHGIIVVPQVLIWGGQQYRDRIDMQPGEFYERLAADRQPPQSSQPTRMDFTSAFTRAVENGASSIVTLVLSSTLSGSIDNARSAAAECAVPVEVIDSRATSMGLGWQVLAAARAIENGLDLQSVLERVSQVRGRIV
ncbi:MAG TPA: DegV family protein, partial [Anaerolineaceae bacterium]|nr:DegV family protein [Anaerolineaceae bacterium]